LVENAFFGGRRPAAAGRASFKETAFQGEVPKAGGRLKEDNPREKSVPGFKSPQPLKTIFLGASSIIVVNEASPKRRRRHDP
jgi:hypothetical protein